MLSSTETAKQRAALNARAAEHRIYEHAAALMANEKERKAAYAVRFALQPDAASRALAGVFAVYRGSLEAAARSGYQVERLLAETRKEEAAT